MAGLNWLVPPGDVRTCVDNAPPGMRQVEVAICSLFVPMCDKHESKEDIMGQADQGRLRDAARTIYDTVYPSEEWTPVPFEDAERLETVHYRNAVAAARFFQPVDQGALL